MCHPRSMPQGNVEPFLLRDVYVVGDEPIPGSGSAARLGVRGRKRG